MTLTKDPTGKVAPAGVRLIPLTKGKFAIENFGEFALLNQVGGSI